MKEVYITSAGVFLPNNPISNDEMEDYLGKLNDIESKLKNRILKQNGIQKRYYALDKKQESTHSNAELAINAIGAAIAKSELRSKEISLLSGLDRIFGKKDLSVTILTTLFVAGIKTTKTVLLFLLSFS